MGGPLLQNHLALLADFKVVRPALGEERVCGLVAMGTARQTSMEFRAIKVPKLAGASPRNLGRRRDWTMQRQHRSASIRGVQCLLWLCMGKPMSVGLLVGRIPGRIRGTTLKVGAGSYTSTCRQQDIPHSVGRPQSRAEDGAGLGLRRSQIAMRWHTPGRLQCRGAENLLGYDVVR